jgi:1-acyl-sn-glycerol-3-phosphate acyltransferase
MCSHLIRGIGMVGRALHLVWHLMQGMFTVAVLFRFLGSEERDRIVRQWSVKCLQILQVRVHITGERPSHRATGTLCVANHVSWIDVLALNAIRPMCFVAKVEVRGWPIIGYLASRAGTVFFTRRPHELIQVNESIRSALHDGRCVALFPEGTTSSGQSVLHFHSGLFQSAVDGQALIWPIALRYSRHDKSLAQHAAFVGNQSLMGSIHRVLTGPPLHLYLRHLPTLDGSRHDRYELAQKTRTAIVSAFQSHSHRPMPELPNIGSQLDWLDEPSSVAS